MWINVIKIKKHWTDQIWIDISTVLVNGSRSRPLNGEIWHLIGPKIIMFAMLEFYKSLGKQGIFDGSNETGGTFLHWLTCTECVKLTNTHKGSLLELVFILQLWLFPLIICLLVWEISHDLQQEHPWTLLSFYTKLKWLIC